MYDEHGEWDDYAAFQVRTSRERICKGCGEYVYLPADQGLCTPCAEDKERQE
jgi:hypothetical protein